MQLNPKEPIQGVSPSILKALFKKQSFTTPQFMLKSGLDEPQASQTLRRIEADRWIEYVRTDNHIDHWTITEHGQRLTATRLLKRFPAETGLALAQRVVAKTRLMNSDPTRSARITEILLFGSLIHAAPSELVGDVDLIVQTAWRKLPRATLKQLQEAECSSAPATLSFIDRLTWPHLQTLRALKRISNRISIHRIEDLEWTNAPHRILYKFDLDSEAEQQPDRKIRTLDPAPRIVGQEPAAATPQSTSTAPPIRDHRPPMPALPTELRYITKPQLAEAQHKWFRYADIEEIAAALGKDPNGIQAYLASPPVPVPARPTFDPSLSITLRQFLPSPLPCVIRVEVQKSSAKPLNSHTAITFQAETTEIQIARAFQSNGQQPSFIGDPRHFSLADQLIKSAGDWHDRISRKNPETLFSCDTFIFPDDGPIAHSAAPTFPDFTACQEPLFALLAEHSQQIADPIDRWDSRIELHLGLKTTLHFLSGQTQHTRPQRIKSTKALTQAITDLQSTRSQAAINLDRLTLLVAGHQLFSDLDS